MTNEVVHPSKYLSETLNEIGVGLGAFSTATGIETMRLAIFMRGQRKLTAEFALLFGAALGQSPEYWMNLQAAYDLAQARQSLGDRLARVTRLPQAV